MRTPAPPTDEMQTEIDFSKGIRGKFAKPGVKLVLPAYADKEAQAAPATPAPGDKGTRSG